MVPSGLIGECLFWSWPAGIAAASVDQIPTSSCRSAEAMPAHAGSGHRWRNSGRAGTRPCTNPLRGRVAWLRCRVIFIGFGRREAAA